MAITIPGLHNRTADSVNLARHLCLAVADLAFAEGLSLPALDIALQSHTIQQGTKRP